MEPHPGGDDERTIMRMALRPRTAVLVFLGYVVVFYGVWASVLVVGLLEFRFSPQPPWHVGTAFLL